MTPMVVARQGFTLVELMIALVLAGAIAGAAYRLILTGQRVGMSQAEHADLQDQLRAGAIIVANELRELGFDSVPPAAGLDIGPAASSDILIAEPSRIRYRAMRGLGFTCAPGTASQILLRSSTWEGLRHPAPGVDSVALFMEGDPALPHDDGWVRARVAGVANGTCTDGTPAITLATSWEAADQGAGAVARAATGGPVRIFEVMEIQLYPQGGESWLGMRSVSRGEVIQPVAGPLAGFTLAYLNRNDDVTADRNEVRTISLTLQGSTAGLLPVVLTSRVALRNMLRP